MDWWQILLILMFLAQVVGCVLLYFAVSGLAQIINSHKKLNESMQTLSEQMADMEEQFVEIKTDVRKVTQYFVNFAKSIKQATSSKPWYDGM